MELVIPSLALLTVVTVVVSGIVVMERIVVRFTTNTSCLVVGDLHINPSRETKTELSDHLLLEVRRTGRLRGGLSHPVPGAAAGHL